MNTITLNIGLALPDGVAELKPQDVMTAVRGSFPGATRGWSIAQSATEPTVVVLLKIPAGADEFFGFIGKVYRLAVLLDQDCIAVSGHDTTAGELIGPNAKAWGEFSPEFFITYEAAVREHYPHLVFDDDGRCIGRLMPEVDPATLITAYRG